MPRPHLPVSVETEVLTLSARRCCICLGLEGDFSRRKGQIAHLDHDSSNNSLENLAYLCLDHHDEFDSRTSQAKGLRENEVKAYREALYSAVSQYLRPRSGKSLLELADHGEEEDALLAKAELAFYLAQHKDYEGQSISVLQEIKELIKRHNDVLIQSRTLAEDLLEAPIGRRDFDGYYKVVAAGLTEFADDLGGCTRRFGVLTSRMLDALTRASVVASDHESASVEMFERKIEDLRFIRGLLEESHRLVGELVHEFRSWSRGTTVYNRGKRLAVASLGQYLVAVEHKIQETRDHEAKLRQVIDLL